MYSESAFTRALVTPNAPLKNLMGPNKSDPGNRLDVYRNNVMASLTEALAVAFPSIQGHLGPKNFHTLATVYIKENLPTSPILSKWGHSFPTFLDMFPALQKQKWLGDVARLEIALRDSYHARDEEPGIIDEIINLTPKNLSTVSFDLCAHTKLIRSRYPILHLYNSGIGNKDTIPQTGQNILVTRKDFDPQPHLLKPGQGLFIHSLIKNYTLQEATEITLQKVPEFKPDTTLKLLYENNAIHSIRQGPQ